MSVSFEDFSGLERVPANTPATPEQLQAISDAAAGLLPCADEVTYHQSLRFPIAPGLPAPAEDGQALYVASELRIGGDKGPLRSLVVSVPVRHGDETSFRVRLEKEASRQGGRSKLELYPYSSQPDYDQIFCNEIERQAGRPDLAGLRPFLGWVANKLGEGTVGATSEVEIGDQEFETLWAPTTATIEEGHRPIQYKARVRAKLDREFGPLEMTALGALPVTGTNQPSALEDLRLVLENDFDFYIGGDGSAFYRATPDRSMQVSRVALAACPQLFRITQSREGGDASHTVESAVEGFSFPALPVYSNANEAKEAARKLHSLLVVRHHDTGRDVPLTQYAANYVVAVLGRVARLGRG